MGKSKKPFIDKKNSSKYHLIYRSQRDVAEEGGEAGVVLWPGPNNNAETDRKVLLADAQVGEPKQDDDDDDDDANDRGVLSSWRQELATAGLVDEYDYEQHTKPISGTGTFLQSATSNEKASRVVEAARARDVREEIVNEVDRQLESITLTCNAEFLDQELAEVLFNDDFDFEGADYEELNDEYFLDAANEEASDEDEDDGASKPKGGFDFAAHVQALMEKARKESAPGLDGNEDHAQAVADMDFFSKGRALRGVDEEDEFENEEYDPNDWQMDGEFDLPPGTAPTLSTAEEQALCDKFLETLADYDDDELGDCEGDEEAMGELPIEGDAHIEAALDDFLNDQCNTDDVYIKGKDQNSTKKTGGSGFGALVGTRMVPAKELDNMPAPVEAPIKEVLADADLALQDPLAAPPVEDVMIDGKSYFSEREQNPFDCESILSTYSNLDNNPVTIGTGGRRSRRKKKKQPQAIDETSVVTEPMPQIRLSDKTGLPILMHNEYDADDGEYEDTVVSVNKGAPRKKMESAEEKKMRKQTVKQERQLARLQKKLMKEAIVDEFSKRTQPVLAEDVGGRTVFRF